MYFYFGLTGGGMTPYEDLADQYWKMRTEYIHACKTNDEEAKKRIIEEEHKAVAEDLSRGPKISEELKNLAAKVFPLES